MLEQRSTFAGDRAVLSSKTVTVWWRTTALGESLGIPIQKSLFDCHSQTSRGYQHAATCAFGDRQAYWFENDGHGVFTNHPIADDQAAYDIRALDIVVDGDIDILIAGQQSRNVAWYENPRQ